MKNFGGIKTTGPAAHRFRAMNMAQGTIIRQTEDYVTWRFLCGDAKRVGRTVVETHPTPKRIRELNTVSTDESFLTMLEPETLARIAALGPRRKLKRVSPKRST